MEFEKLLQALVQGDREAFQRFYDGYGLPLYRYILEKTGDPERTRRLWKDVFRALMTHLRKSGSADLPLLLLTALADAQIAAEQPCDTVETQAERLSSELLDELQQEVAPTEASVEASVSPVTEPEEDRSASAPLEAEDTPKADAASARTVMPSEEMLDDFVLQAPVRKKNRGFWVFLLVVLILLAAVLLWGSVGFLMSYGVLPAYDLGYSWFNTQLFPLFPAPF